MASNRNAIPGLGTKLADLSLQRTRGFQVKSFVTRTLIPMILSNITNDSMEGLGETCMLPNKVSSTMTLKLAFE